MYVPAYTSTDKYNPHHTSADRFPDVRGEACQASLFRELSLNVPPSVTLPLVNGTLNCQYQTIQSQDPPVTKWLPLTEGEYRFWRHQPSKSAEEIQLAIYAAASTLTISSLKLLAVISLFLSCYPAPRMDHSVRKIT